jgi:hypothetical protein
MFEFIDEHMNEDDADYLVPLWAEWVAREAQRIRRERLLEQLHVGVRVLVEVIVAIGLVLVALSLLLR